MNPNLLALIVAAIWGLAPIFEKMSLKELNPMLVLFVRFILVTCLILPFYLTSNNFSRVGIIKNPIMSVANPGIINNKAAKAIAAPEIISYAGVSCLIICEYAERKVFKPSYLA